MIDDGFDHAHQAQGIADDTEKFRKHLEENAAARGSTPESIVPPQKGLPQQLRKACWNKEISPLIQLFTGIEQFGSPFRGKLMD